MASHTILDQLPGAAIVHAGATSRRRAFAPEALVPLNSAWYRPRSGAIRHQRRGTRVVR